MKMVITSDVKTGFFPKLATVWPKPFFTGYRKVTKH